MRLAATREIARSAEDVFEFFADASNNPRWQRGMESCEWTSEPPIGAGSTYAQRARFMGRPVVTTFVVTEFEPGRKIAFESVRSTFPIEVERSVEPTGPESCKVSAVIGGGPETLAATLLAPVITWFAQRSVDADYDRLVRLLESN